MKTLFDLVSVVVFAALAVVFLHRCSRKARDRTPLWAYGLAALGCAMANGLGNAGQPAVAGVLLAAVMGFVVWLVVTEKPSLM